MGCPSKTEQVAVDVVHWDLSRQHHDLDDLAALLSPDEIERANRLVLPPHRRRFVLARGLLRRTLATAAGCDPATLRFSRGTDGKPSLIDHQLEFSLSHSQDGLLIALAWDAVVGCDLESVRSSPEAMAIAGRWFTDAEQQAIAASADRDRAFLSCWVRKEAVLKALGTGLQIPLDFTVGPGRPDGAEGRVTVKARDCWLVDVTLSPGWVAAVAAERPMQVTLRSFSF